MRPQALSCSLLPCRHNAGRHTCRDMPEEPAHSSMLESPGGLGEASEASLHSPSHSRRFMVYALLQDGWGPCRQNTYVRMEACPVQAACSLTRVCWSLAIARVAATNHKKRKVYSAQAFEPSPEQSSTRCCKFLIWTQRPRHHLEPRVGCYPQTSTP